jgi:uncharacterized protein (DUF1697 family)
MDQIRYVCLLRGINVGGSKKVSMEILKNMMVSLGFQNVKTYINSGNVLFDAEETNAEILSEKISKAFISEFGFDSKIMIRIIEEIKEILENNPFKELKEGEVLYVPFLSDKLSQEQKDLFKNIESEIYSYGMRDQEVYVLRHKIIPNDPFSNNWLEKLIKTSATTRNINTVNKIASL